VIEAVLRAFERLVTDFSWKRLTLLGVLIATSFTLLIVFERTTATWRLSRLERSATLLEHLAQVRRDASADSGETTRLADSLLQQLRAVIQEPPVSATMSPSLLRALVAALPWWLFAIAFAPGVKRGSSSDLAGLLGAVICGVLFGWLGLLLPDGLSPAVYYVVYPIGHFLAVVLLVSWWQARPGRRRAAAEGQASEQEPEETSQ
jgi:hypothetical protein